MSIIPCQLIQSNHNPPFVLLSLVTFATKYCRVTSVLFLRQNHSQKNHKNTESKRWTGAAVDMYFRIPVADPVGVCWITAFLDCRVRDVNSTANYTHSHTPKRARRYTSRSICCFFPYTSSYCAYEAQTRTQTHKHARTNTHPLRKNVFQCTLPCFLLSGFFLTCYSFVWRGPSVTHTTAHEKRAHVA